MSTVCLRAAGALAGERARAPSREAERLKRRRRGCAERGAEASAPLPAAAVTRDTPLNSGVGAPSSNLR